MHEICSFIKELVPPINDLVDGLKQNGFKVSRTHYNPNGIKTDAKVVDVVEWICEYNKNKK